ncbi:M23 family metallopeptidase [Rathayibacter sp. VKM Ac-2927]|uniref:M23 family metallopeptidase n=1 Tax=Rathayibacter sp. VKM Ac-2927 TaxID=2929478 RepID=UPI001FB21FA6|nr:M23 family metallopeptidase [Rathayibacter sp. VKM Ac-2927]MCJ1687792.1 M23 family metallopeptidase [Rathayibacter sp. VKM Ac-2927]
MPTADWRAFYNPANFTTPFRAQGPFYSSFGHRGLDINASARRPIPVWAPGDVYVVSSTGGLGPVVGIRIDDSDKRAAWAHLWGITVSVGQHLEPGDVVGYAAGAGDFHGSAWSGSHSHTTYGSADGIWQGITDGLMDPDPAIRAALAGDWPDTGDGGEEPGENPNDPGDPGGGNLTIGADGRFTRSANGAGNVGLGADGRLTRTDRGSGDLQIDASGRLFRAA